MFIHIDSCTQFVCRNASFLHFLKPNPIIGPFNNNPKELHIVLPWIVLKHQKKLCENYFIYLRTIIPVLPLGLKRLMRGKSRAFISSTMNTTLEHLTRGSKQTGNSINAISLSVVLFTPFSLEHKCCCDDEPLISLQSSTWKSLSDSWCSF